MSTESDLGILHHVINILEPGLLGQPLSGTFPVSMAKGKIMDYHYLQTVEILLLLLLTHSGQSFWTNGSIILPRVWKGMNCNIKGAVNIFISHFSIIP